MALFVHVLRLVMLFLNIYDSYKTLRQPPPSTRNEGRPSQRALTQRKRDMKGCLAVWIVWMCIATYEGYAEGLVSLLVPFYDEIKSLGLLFLIMTRARGAEPIFLNIIRPLVKPYTPTIDLFLDLARMIGDISFTVFTIPVELVYTWYKKLVPYSNHGLDTEPVTSVETSSAPMEPPSSSEEVLVKNGEYDQQSVRFPKKTNFEAQSSGENERPRTRLPVRVDQVGRRTHSKTQQSDPYKIWYPPAASYSDDEDTLAPSQNDARPNINIEPPPPSEKVLQEQKAFDEWRQYPAFPSAYPPTPMVMASATLHSTSATTGRMPHLANSLMLTELLEEVPQQDFSQSLLPPRKPLNPGFVKGLSDDTESFGVLEPEHLDPMSVDSDNDDEDIFNTTLQTPPRRTTLTGFIPILPINREVSVASSVATLATAISTDAHDYSLRTRSSSESLGSDALSLRTSSPVVGRKRPLPLDKLDLNSTLEVTEARKAGERVDANVRVGSSQAPIEIFEESDATTLSTADTNDDRKPTPPKRRKVGSQAPRVASRPTRPRIAQTATAPTKATIPKPPMGTQSRLAPAASTRPATHGTTKATISSRASRSKLSSGESVARSQSTQPNNSARAGMKDKSHQVTTSHPLQRGP